MRVWFLVRVVFFVGWLWWVFALTVCGVGHIGQGFWLTRTYYIMGDKKYNTYIREERSDDRSRFTPV
jgi:hypothetical protein